ncbi:class I SAM-dependent methyltransferase [Patescibacteria group bacterium]|nr:class I SAM-dependent methyltransferase [Patescibacteria group bacterium]MBU4274593.1 class I SAM-dependent methyltransferase [Patescibacteria group bacterium]MBU4367800.1 class I SAM-dependent methyltransferase [Patescibacteria group bacterium]MBU4461504.1 class I SAM-dependent methyltransferase [Patescibacteria group bacterium]MCG2699958.1 class I SAM-dependent methyltransferase [Candidatus Parcubacteria bacterium]
MKNDIELKSKKYNNDLFLTYGEEAKYIVEKNWKNHLKYFLEYFSSHIKKDNSKTTLLDVGCGAGLISKELLKYGFKIYGVDFSSEAIKFAKIENPGIDFQHSSIYELPFSNESFDIIICLGVFQTVADPDKAIAEMTRVLKKSGILIIRTLNTLFLLSFKGKKDNPDYIFYNPFDFKKMMEKEGLNVYSLKGIYSFLKRFNFLINFLVKTKLYKIFNFLFFPIFVFLSPGFYIEGRKNK